MLLWVGDIYDEHFEDLLRQRSRSALPDRSKTNGARSAQSRVE